jgi:hypothetical protein
VIEVEGVGSKRPFRFGVLIDASGLSRWQADCIRGVSSSGIGTPVIVVNAKCTQAPRRRGTLGRVIRRFAMTAIGMPRSSILVDVATLGIDTVITSAQLSNGPILELEREQLQALNAFDLDFILYTGFLEPRGAILKAARLGVWSLRDGKCAPDGQPSMFWKMSDSEAGFTVCLWRYTPEAGSVLRNGRYPIVGHSYRDTIDHARAASLDFPMLAYNDLAAGVVGQSQAVECTSSPEGLGFRPMLRLLWELWSERLRSLVDLGFFRRSWNIGLVRSGDLDPTVAKRADQVQWLQPDSRNAFAADPFMLRYGDGIGLLGEVRDEKDGRGVIAAWWIGPSGVRYLGVVIAEPGVHISYPYLFRWKEEIYCLPERAQVGGPILYRALEFPTRWERLAELLPGVQAVDPTVFELDGRWWLACTDNAKDCHSWMLLFHSGQPLGPWQPHPRNPVKIDPRCSRGAGTPFLYHGHLVRPSQDCSVSYGARVVFNRIVRCTTTDFFEEPLGELLPDSGGPFPTGLHTVSFDPVIAAVDGLKIDFAPLAWWDYIKHRFRPALGRSAAIVRDAAPIQAR